MEVTCLRKDMDKFAKLGFSLHDDQDDDGDDSESVQMIDHDANSAHCGNLPMVAFIANNDAAIEYGASETVCDGENIAEWECGNGQTGYVFCEVDRPGGEAELGRFREYQAVRRRASLLLGYADGE